MEVLVTIRNINKYNTFKSLADGIIVGSLFTSGYHLSRNEMRQLRISCLNDGKKYYVVIDDFICESDKSSFFDYFDFVVSLKPDCKDYKPLNVYGQTKLEGELAVSETLDKYFIVRIAWVFGKNGKGLSFDMLDDFTSKYGVDFNKANIDEVLYLAKKTKYR